MAQTRPTQTRPALFISHSSRDKAWAMRLHDALIADGYGAFLDSHPDDGIHPGAEWEKLLWQRLRECGGVVVLCSAYWLKSPWCVAEAMIAREHGKTIFLLATGDVIDARQVKGGDGAEDALQIPDFLKGRQFISIAGLAFDQALQQLRTGFEKEKLNEEFAVLGPPYPGLEPFQERDAAVFFGRRDEIESVKNVLKKRRLNNAKGFIVVLGASGCGKSSLVRAGVLPRLRRAGEEKDSTAEWVIVPPFFGREGLEGLVRSFDDAFNKADQPQTPQSLRQRLAPSRGETGEPQCDVRAVAELATHLLSARRLPESHILLVLDQLEEVFATKEDLDPRAMLRLLLDASSDPASRVVVLATMRSDFLDAFQKFEGAAQHYEKITLDPMQKERFAEIIEGPARCCGLKLGPGLSESMVEDTKYADALPLLAFTLKRLHDEYGADGKLELAEYEKLFPPVAVHGSAAKVRGVSAAIKITADEILEETDYVKNGKPLPDDDERMRDLRRAFYRLAYRLAQVGEEGQFTRRTARRSQMPTSCETILERFVGQRLLVSGKDEQGKATLTVAHEALFRVWDTLNGWLREDSKALALRTQIEDAAAEWQAENRTASRAWVEERILDAVRMIEDSGVLLDDVTDRATVDAFLGPTKPEEIATLPALDAAQDAAAGSGRYGDAWRLPLGHEARASVGVRLALLGDRRRKGVGLGTDGLPDIDWVAIDGGEVTIEIRKDPDDADSEVIDRLTRSVAPFWMARYPVTVAQFQAFMGECHREGEWRLRRLPPGFPLDLPSSYPPPKHRARHGNHPADSVNWWDAQAFCHWLGARVKFEVRLPTEAEWQLAATGGDAERIYPWGGEWDPEQEPWRANTLESGLGRSTAVGMYPAGASPAGIMDMAGTLWEWCLDSFESAETRGETWFGRLFSKRSVEEDRRVLRGGAWYYSQVLARAAGRWSWSFPLGRSDTVGFRVVRSSPSSGH